MEHKTSSDEVNTILKDRWLDKSDKRTVFDSGRGYRRGHLGRTRHFATGALFCLLGLFLWVVPGARFKWSYFRVPPTQDSSVNAPYNIASPLPFANDWNWTDHKPTKLPNWTDCFHLFDLQYQCARLSVPLDYSEPDGEQAAIALVRHQSLYPPGHEKYKGPILFNPGGPGGSGVATVLAASPSFRKIIGDEFDFIGFDPRGVLFTTPKADVFETTIEAAKFILEMPPTLNASSSAFSEVYVRSKVLGKLAEVRAEKYASHMSTATVATDMLSIVNATGFEKLQYWGFSYGSVLGATFAAMFPDKVGRIIIDGVVDAEDYYAGLWSNNLRDTDAALFDIYESCVRVGQDNCPIYEESAELIAERVDKLLAKIKAEPIPFLSVGGGRRDTYGIIDYSKVKSWIFSTLYNTHGSSAFLVFLLSSLERGDLLTVYRSLDLLLTCQCPESSDIWDGLTPTLAIACGDAAPIEETLEDAHALYERMAQNTTFSDVWPIHLACSGWTIRAKDRFKGSFEQNTSHPLLLVGNTADPVTPLWNAHKMSKGFNNSVVLTQNSSGHCSISATSLCTSKAVRSYFLNGTLPDKGTVCQTESSIFGNVLDNTRNLNAEDKILLQAAEELRQMRIVPRLFEGSWASNIDWEPAKGGHHF